VGVATYVVSVVRIVRSPITGVTGTLLVSGLLIVILAIAVQGAFATRAGISDTFARQSRMQQAQIALEDLLRLQIDEEDSVRGYSLTRDPFYKLQYAAALATFDRREWDVGLALRAEHLPERTLEEYSNLQATWRSTIARTLLANPGQPLAEIDKENKVFSDFENRTAQAVRFELAQTSAKLAESTQRQVDRTLLVRAFWLAMFGLLAIVFNVYRSRLNRALEEERTTTEILQRAFRSEHVPLPRCEIGSAYLSASSQLAVGGDVFDVYRLSDSLALVFIADVSGKGVDAAVLTAFIKFTIRGIALRRRDPGAMLAEFNTAFAQTVENPYLFVSMFIGVLDLDSFQLRYASAGHDSAFVRRASGMQRLAVTGPVLGVMEEPFETKVVNLEGGDTLVLATDGLTEARTPSGEQLSEEGAMKLIAASSVQPQQLANELAARIKTLGGNQTRDDLAILAIRIHEPEARREAM